MTRPELQWMVVTDLDGTMMSHDDYSLRGIKAVVDNLTMQNIPVVFNTSKTYAESRTIQQLLGIDAPFIVENGSCIFLPYSGYKEAPLAAVRRGEFWALSLGQTQQHISAILEELKSTYQDYTALSQCTAEQAVALTGLTQEQASQAISREFSEPLIWQGSQDTKQAFIAALSEHNLTTLQGGRFLHVLGQTDKGRAMQALLDCHAIQIKTIVLGDSANDVAMLKHADIAIVVHSPANQHMEQIIHPYFKTDASAPEGWIEGVTKALQHIKTNQESL